ncbi:hypothetical protein M569_02797 [Genlisea aurea]|uniref:Smr domain-containing protein n=1 Tax=Genlisea aurea TaxID=192259 RepID=S8D3I3_9LAMI|nr:hypothetical protein M569_02797 [Genlisea aurea]
MASSVTAPSLSREKSHFFSSYFPSTRLNRTRSYGILIFPSKFPPRNPSNAISCSVSSPESAVEIAATEDYYYYDVKSSASPSKSSVWINPKSSRAPKLRKKSPDFRYAKVVEALNSGDTTEESFIRSLKLIGDAVSESDSVFILNSLTNAKSAKLALNYILEKNSNAADRALYYNVAMKACRKSKDMDSTESLFGEMIEKGIQPDNYTFSTIISCARHCSLPEKSVEWFEKMPSFGCEPDSVTLSVMIDAYGKVGKADLALRLYDRAKNENWRLDAQTFSTLIRIHGSSGNFDGCLNLYQDMKALKVRPNAGVYNSVLDAMGRAKRPWQAKVIYKEMALNGIQPTWGTYASLIRAYSRSRFGRDAVAVYREMKQKGFELNLVLYNTLLSACADVGFSDEALEIFRDMKLSGVPPDSWSYSSLIAIHSCGGDVEKAEAALAEMAESGFGPNIFVLTSIVQCYGKSGRADDVVRTFRRAAELGIVPDDRFTSCLLSALLQAGDSREELAGCIEEANPRLGSVVKLIMLGESDGFKKRAGEVLEATCVDVRKALCNCLIDLCVSSDRVGSACELLELGISLGIYGEITSRTEMQWSLHLKGLSPGAALTALHVWMKDLSETLSDDGEELPPLLGINTGHGKHRFSEKGLAGVFESHLKELNAPFHEAPDKVGWFLTTKSAATSWLKSSSSRS